MAKFNSAASSLTHDSATRRERPGSSAKEPVVKKPATVNIPDMLRPGKLFAWFGLQQELEPGSTGATWLAQDYSVGRQAEQVALKFLPDVVVYDKGALEALKIEIGRASLLRHPNILSVYDLVEDKGKAAIQSEYVDGKSLSSLLSARPNQVFEVRDLEKWVGELCEALQYAHQEGGFVAGCLWPGHLIVDLAGKLKVKDLGIENCIAKQMSRLKAKHDFGATLPYQSPQQVARGEPAITDDLYSLGAIIYELLTSKPPLYAEDGKIPSSMSERRAELGIPGGAIPGNWEETVAACLAQDPWRRPQSAVEVERQLKNTPSPAGVPTPTKSKPKTVNKSVKPQSPDRARPVRRPWLVAVAILSILAAVAAIAFFSFHALVKPGPGEVVLNNPPAKANIFLGQASPKPTVRPSPLGSNGQESSRTAVPVEPSPVPSPEVNPNPTAKVNPTPSAGVSPTPFVGASPTPSPEASPTPPAEVPPTPSAGVSPTPSAQGSPESSSGAAPAPSSSEPATPHQNQAAAQTAPSQPDADAIREDVIKRINALPGVTAEKKANLIENMKKARAMERLMVIPFDSGRATLRRAAADDLVKAFDRPEIRDKLSDPTIIVVVAGYADAGGRSDVNLRISQTRAENVSKILKEQAKLLNAMQTIGMGGTELLDSKRPDQNRAVEVWVVVPF